MKIVSYGNKFGVVGDDWFSNGDGPMVFYNTRVDAEYALERHNKAVGKTKVPDEVNSPSHYRQGKIEAIQYIRDILSREEFIGYCRGNIAKYLHRYRYKKKPVEDVKKAQWYSNELIKAEEMTDEEWKDYNG